MTYSRAAGVAALLALAIWAITSKKSSELHTAIIFGMLFVALLFLNPSVSRRFSTQLQPKDYSAQYQPEFNITQQHPNVSANLLIHVRNTGATTWEARATGPFSLAHRWCDAEKKIYVREAVERILIPTPVRPKESVDIQASFRTPEKTGVYLLTWDIFSEESGWFSRQGIYPGIVEVHVDPDKESWSGHTDISRWLQRDTSSLFVRNIPYSRSELWKAAVRMAREHPIFGVGPDNFRLLYGRQYGAKTWDTKIRANSLYLELLSGGGVAGLAAFCVMMAMVRWKPTAPCIALGIFLIHGLLDTFLMTTPIYFAFWILLGQSEDITQTS